MTRMNVEDLVKLTEISQRITKMVNSMEFDWERLRYDMWNCCRGQEEFFDYIEYCNGEFRDQSFEGQRYRASGLNLLTAAIVLWNTVYIERAVNTLRTSGYEINDEHLQYLSPLGWEHINLTGDYVWKSSFEVGKGKFRPFRGNSED